MVAVPQVASVDPVNSTVLGLFTQHGFPGLRGGDGQRRVQVIGQRIVDRVDVRVGEQFLVAAEGTRNIVLFRKRLRAAQIAAGDCRHNPVARSVNGRDHAVPADVCGAEYPPTNLFRK